MLETNAQEGRRAMALVIVLSALTLLAVLAIAFLSSSRTELHSSRTFADGNRARILSQSAISLAMAQITAGTKGIDSNGRPLAWASQPGMIRVYDEAGEAVQQFKLYSWDKMATSGSPDLTAERAELNHWATDKAIFTDLNQPAISSGEKVYPIIDGNSLTLSVNDLNGAARTYDNGSGQPAIEGFSVTTATNPATAENPVPMPVKWLYVLEQGQLVAPDGGSENKATFAPGQGPSADNPIVGRIAFWTDDETCKININTASEGVYWDAPRLTSYSLDDWNLESNQPVRGEYQRYPGHPAMTCLSTVFPTQQVRDIYDLIPRIGKGGSDGGSQRTAWTDGAPTYQPLTLDSDRLYATIDELAFLPDRTTNEKVLQNPSDALRLERAKFFLSAHNRAPEVTLFGTPRINIWPVHSSETGGYRSACDSAFAFCSTMRNDLGTGKYRYYFQRENADDSTQDLPSSGSVVGLGRNRMLLEYLRNLTSRQVPGFGGSFQTKYAAGDVAGLVQGTERDQILTQIFDYIRSTNLADSTVAKTKWFAQGGQVVPIDDLTNGTRGFGRYRTVEGANFLFIGVKNSTLDPAITPGQIRTQAMFIPQLFSVAVGSVFLTESFQISIEGLDQFQWTGANGIKSSMGFPAVLTADLLRPDRTSTPGLGANWGDQPGISPFASDDRFFSPAALDVAGSFVFHGGKITIRLLTAGKEVQSVQLEFPESTFPAPTLSDAGYRTPTERQQKYVSGQANNASWLRLQDVIRSVASSHGDIRLIAARKKTPEPGKTGYPFADNLMYHRLDTPLKWAHSLWSGLGTPYPYALGISGGPAGVTTGKLLKDAIYEATYAQVFSDTPLNGVALGKKTSFLEGDLPGDWDTGVAEMRDGPFINKPDEGDIGAGSGNSVIAYPYKWKNKAGVHSPSETLFSPNRLIPSPVTFGSLPTGVLADKPWQTLQFRPGPIGHPGLGTPAHNRSIASLAGVPPYSAPPDHLLLDLFWMPIVEPYPISEPFSTAGKINMNYQVIPFSWINRTTGLRAILKPEKVISIQTAGLNCDARKYKAGFKPDGIRVPGMSRQAVDADETLVAFRDRFSSGDIFRSPSEICDLDIVPADYSGIRPHTRSSMDDYWKLRLLTGDNCRERPYATIYPRLTTQSNTFTIHVRAQSLRKSKLTPAELWDEKRDVITGEYRGLQTIERYIDPNDPTVPDYAAGSNRALSGFYRYRVLHNRQFAP